jgi:hypothetical protein
MLARFYYDTAAGAYESNVPVWLFKNFGLLTNQGVPGAVSSSDMTTLIILVVVAIAVFLIGVKGNDMILTWLEKERVQSAVESRKSQMELARANEKLKAEDMMKK